MKAIHIFHHDDLDGKVSAAVMYEYYRNFRKEYRKTFFHECNYTEPLYFSDIPDGDAIIIVDYAPRSNVKDIADIIEAKNHEFVWIDHHKTSFDMLDEIKIYDDTLRDAMLAGDLQRDYKAKVYLNESYCAAYLCYEWCIRQKYPNMSVERIEMPDLIKYTDSHDRWKFYMDRTADFVYGTNSFEFDPNNLFKIVHKQPKEMFTQPLLKNIKKENESFINQTITKGKPIKIYEDNKNETAYRHHGFDFTIIDRIDKNNEQIYSCTALNIRGNSSVFGDSYNRNDIVVPFSYDSNGYKYSFYSKKEAWKGILNCKEIAKLLSDKFGDCSGGGHLNAAGCTLYQQILSKNCIIIFRKGLFGNIKIEILKDPKYMFYNMRPKK